MLEARYSIRIPRYVERLNGESEGDKDGQEGRKQKRHKLIGILKVSYFAPSPTEVNRMRKVLHKLNLLRYALIFCRNGPYPVHPLRFVELLVSSPSEDGYSAYSI